jgi:Holliday junction DNA helicase RuvA
MISHLQGTIIFRGKDFIMVDVHGIGYKVFLARETLSKLSEKQQIAKLYTFLHWREGTPELYGFLSYSELELFETLNNISGVGPRTALQLASFGSLERLKSELANGKLSLKGIGRKKLQKIMLEITGKLKEISLMHITEEKRDDALEALVSLGIPRRRAYAALQQVAPDIENVQQRVREALQIIGRQQKT